jgi:uncharacterized Tic20 family protein
MRPTYGSRATFSAVLRIVGSTQGGVNVEEEKKPAESIPAEAAPEAAADEAPSRPPFREVRREGASEVTPIGATPAEAAPTEAAPAEEAPAEVMPPEEARPSQNDCNLAALAHGSTLLNLFFPGLGILAALLIWLNVKERSRYASFQSLQAMAFQVAALLVTLLGAILVTVAWVVSGLLAAVLVGCLLMPFALLLTIAVVLVPIAGLVYGLVGAYETYYGRDFRYWLVGEWLEREQAR